MSRSIEITKDIDAPVDAVWRAITDAKQLAQWFVIDARVEPKANGKIWVSWGEGAEIESTILHWERNKRFGWGEEWNGQLMATDFHLEARGAKTVVRVVTSGFSEDPAWDDDFHMVEAGWQYFMSHLKVLVEHHRDRERALVLSRRQTTLTKADALTRLARAFGFSAMPDRPGPFSVTTSQGDALTGEIVALNPGFQLAVRIDNLNHAMLFFEMEGKKDSAKPAMWLSTWDLPAAEQTGVADRMRALYDAALA
jgi:uncharacterized protein YndB with AHSA1/START domain